MRYIVVHWKQESLQEWEQQLLEQDLADIGFEAFDGPKSYIQESLFHEDALNQVMQCHPHAQLIGWETCPDENWNQAWEEEHPEFEYAVGSQMVRIHPHCAFGAGYHETTSMMVDTLVAKREWLCGKRVMDNGCGTGILGIVAVVAGAEHVSAIDIDENSTRNTEENMQQNGIRSHQYTIVCQDHPLQGAYDLILSNIHTNILLRQMDTYAHCLNAGGELWISGFYESDIPALRQSVETHGMHVIQILERGEWRMMICQH